MDAVSLVCSEARRKRLAQESLRRQGYDVYPPPTRPCPREDGPEAATRDAAPARAARRKRA